MAAPEEAFEPMQNDLIIRAAWGQKVERPPIWIMRQAGRYLPEYHEAKGNHDFFTCCRTPEIACTLTLQPIERFSPLIDAAIIFSDILVIPQALGMTVEMVERKGPTFPTPLRCPPADDPQFAAVLARPLDAVLAELDYVFRAITLTRRRLRGRVPLIGFCGAPWTLLCYMTEGGGTKMFKQSKTWVYRYGEEAKALLGKIAQVCIEYLARQVKAGAQLVQVFDSWAGELSPAMFDEFAGPYLAEIARGLPRRLEEMGLPRVPMIAFPKGAWYALEKVAAMGYQVVSLDWLHDPATAVRAVAREGEGEGPPVVLQGNADPGVLYGSRAAITRAVEDMVHGFGWAERRSGWICNLGHGITPFVDPDDVKFFFEEVHRLTTATTATS